MPKMLSIPEWVKREVTLTGTCYIAIMMNDDGYDLEIEESSDSIHAVYATGTRDLKKARQLANQMDKALTKRGIKVFKTRQHWDAFLWAMAGPCV
jgi:hypothetical protein